MQGSKKEEVPPGKTVIDLNSCHRNTHRGSHCGYCKGKKKNPGHADWGITSDKMSVVDYQKLMDRGWRRMGTYYYKYDFTNSCCQPYTIRLDTREFTISKSQKKVMKRFNKYLCGDLEEEGVDQARAGSKEEEKKDTTVRMKVDETYSILIKEKIEKQQRAILKQVLDNLQVLLDLSTIKPDFEKELVTKSIISKSRDKQLSLTKSWSSNLLIKLTFGLKDVLPDSMKTIKDVVSFIKGKNNELMNLTKVLNDVEEIRIEDSGYITFVNMEKEEAPQIQKSDAQKQQKGQKKEEEKKEEQKKPTIQEELNYTQYFKEFAPLKEEQKKKGLKHKYTVQITRAICQRDSFEIYAKYQEKIHGEPEKSVSGYDRFLCESPLFDPNDKDESIVDPLLNENPDERRVTKDEGVWPEYLGSYHMIHRIDGEILAVGVLDFTPNVLSSVYLYYNPKFEFLQPGIFSAVREIEYCLRIQEFFKQDFYYYYMGLYFQDCQKSVYKGTYKPSQVLCPITCNYVYLTEEVKEMIAKEIMPKLCQDKPKIRELDLNQNQVQNLLKNFTFLISSRKIKVKIEDISARKQVEALVRDLYLTLGLDVMLSSYFVV